MTAQGGDHRDRERQLLREYSSLEEGDPRHAAVRDELVTMHLPLVRHLAHRYRDRGEALEDLTQVGTVGLIKAVDRFDVDRGVEFSTFATPTILGEIKRHFRDRAWTIRVPRRLQELQAQVATRSDELTRTLHRAPTVRELAADLDVGEDAVLEAIEARHAFSTGSIDVGSGDDGHGSAPLTDRLVFEEAGFESIDDRESLRPLLEQLSERERRILFLRFFQNMSQVQIAEELGISQMQVSRLLARSLSRLREGVQDSYSD